MTMPKKTAQTRQAIQAKAPIHQSVYEKLRGEILFGELAPGQAVTIQGIATRLDAGMTPVREAIRRLISEGALNMMGNRRVILPEMTTDCVAELVFIRKMIEPELARRATSRMSADILSRLEAEDSLLNTAISTGNIPAYLTHNYRFHRRIYATACSPIMASTVDRLWLRFGPSLRVVCGRSGTLNLPDKHAELLTALAGRDEAAAALAMAEDVEQGMSQIRASLLHPA